MRRSAQRYSAEMHPDGLSAQCPRSATTRRRTPRWVVVAGLVLLAAGCSGGDSSGNQASPEAAGREALAAHDGNKDGVLDAKELEACPGLLSALKRVDTNSDGRLSADEIADRLSYFRQQGMQMDVSVELTLDGRPLGGATVTLVPEKFMGPSVKPAMTVTDESGAGYFATEDSGDIAVAPGYYRVQVSKNVQGRETIPAKYNTQTVLGQEVVPEADGRGSSKTIKLRLTR